MSKRTSIPDFTEEPQSMANALRAIKDVVEQLAGQRQGESLGSPLIFVQGKAPTNNVRISLQRGDLWINDAASPKAISYWDGRMWVAVG